MRPIGHLGAHGMRAAQFEDGWDYSVFLMREVFGMNVEDPQNRAKLMTFLRQVANGEITPVSGTADMGFSPEISRIVEVARPTIAGEHRDYAARILAWLERYPPLD